MTVEATGRRWFQFSLRSILILTAIAAILLTINTWVAQARQQIIRARMEADMAQQEARAAAALAQLAASQAAVPTAASGSKPVPDSRQPATTNNAPDLVERLQRENAQLKDKVKALLREIERLKAG